MPLGSKAWQSCQPCKFPNLIFSLPSYQMMHALQRQFRCGQLAAGTATNASAARGRASSGPQPLSSPRARRLPRTCPMIVHISHLK